jgi:hypothetical protein
VIGCGITVLIWKYQQLFPRWTPTFSKRQLTVWKLTYQKQELPIVAMFVKGSERNDTIIIEDILYVLSANFVIFLSETA